MGLIFTQVDWNATTIDVLTVETASAELVAFLEGKGFARVFCVALDSVFVAACVEINILRRVRAASSRRPPRHRRDACSMAWRYRFLDTRRTG